MLKLITFLIAIRILKQIENNYIKKCVECGEELDIEDYFFNNFCEYCGSTQGYDKEIFEMGYC